MAVRPTHRRLFGGRSTPAIRAILSSLTLALAVFRVLANHANHAAPMNNLALHADFFDRCPDFHFIDSVPRGNFRGPIPFPKLPEHLPGGRPRHYTQSLELLVPIHDAAARQIVGRQLYRYAVAGQDADEILPHLARDVREHLMLVLQLDAKHGVGKRFDHRGHHFDGVFLAAFARFFVLLGFSRHALLISAHRKTCRAEDPGATFKAETLPTGTLYFLWPGQYPRTVAGYGYGVLEMGRVAAVGRDRGPIVVEHPHRGAAAIHHRLEGLDQRP